MTILSQLVYFFKSHSLKVGAELLPRGDRRGKKKSHPKRTVKKI